MGVRGGGAGGGGVLVNNTSSWWEGSDENFLLQGQLSVLTLISLSVSPPFYRSSTLKIPSILPKVQVAG